jgi:DNA-binding transcriptional MerR regulator
MKKRTYTIGEAAQICGVTVRKLRFYSDADLLPAGRSDSGYRIYTDADLVRLDLICSLREAGLALDAIRLVFSRELCLGDALRLRLVALETEIAAKRRIVAAIRAALRNPDPTEEDVRRLFDMTKISHDERRAVIESFYDNISEGAQVDPEWKRKMIDASVPELPDEPTPQQIDAWIELSEIVKDLSFVSAMREKSKQEWQEGLDHAAHAKLFGEVLSKAHAAIEAGDPPDSATGEAIAREWITASAHLSGREPDEMFKGYLRTTFGDRDPRKMRYWELVAILRGDEPDASPNREWAWIIDAMRHYLT